jgi:uncharacterized membrane protein YgcG
LYQEVYLLFLTCNLFIFFLGICLKNVVFRRYGEIVSLFPVGSMSSKRLGVVVGQYRKRTSGGGAQASGSKRQKGDNNLVIDLVEQENGEGSDNSGPHEEPEPEKQKNSKKRGK